MPFLDEARVYDALIDPDDPDADDEGNGQAILEGLEELAARVLEIGATHGGDATILLHYLNRIAETTADGKPVHEAVKASLS